MSRPAALIIVVVLLSGCASRSAGAAGRSSNPDAHTSSHPSSVGASNYVTGDCARIMSLTGLIRSSGNHYTWSLGSLHPAGQTRVIDAGPNNQPEVFTGFVFSPATALYGSAPPRQATVWAAGGTQGNDTTTTDSTLDFATSPSGTALVSLFPSSNLPGQYEFEALPATRTSVLMINSGCWLASTPIGDADQVKRLTAQSRYEAARPAMVPVVRYHNGKAAGPQSVPARLLPIAALRTLLRRR